MQIDWITVSAQIVNFLLLVWLLKHFLYGPVIRAMNRREERISERLDEAREREKEAQQEARRYEQKTAELEAQREEMLATARQEAEEEKKRLLDEARTEAHEARDEWRQEVERERVDFLDGLRRHIGRNFHDLARKALGELADARLEAQVVEVFIDRLKSLDQEDARALAADTDRLAVASAFELDSATRSRLTRAIHDELGKNLDVEYRQAEEVVCGLVLAGGGVRIGWNLAHYLDDLAAAVEETLAAPEAARE
ncbi:F0F1 ATP synthase subunit B [Thioalkalivibrio sp. XN8]|uniref:F0F1 ATP synthase subunit B n=1 Tax=Thioalkalivibrio sp. XN8 TaxID=2712863 RepID=UPI0013EA4BAB|nr:F0F1 ATP synthase subunit B [Thioalkalivibrio sp. XN8]NGP54501.1 F0F1 ATP synthase subunit B [Thioalkalivibrio sp. XN8]